MAESVRLKLETPLSALFLHALAEEARHRGYRQALHFRDPGGPEITEYRRDDAIVAVRCDATQAHYVWVEVETESGDVLPLVEAGASRAAADVVAALAWALGRGLADDARARLRDDLQRLLGGASTSGQ